MPSHPIVAPADSGPVALPVVAFPTRLLSATLALTICGWLIVGSLTYSAYRESSQVQSRNLQLADLRGTIAHLDEVLTMSARMAAMTGDPQWERRYRASEQPLDRAIKRTMELARQSPTAADAAQTDQANQALVAMENQAFDLVRAGLREQARTVLFSATYEADKKLYSAGMAALDARIGAELAANQQETTRRTFWFAAATAVLISLLLYAWYIVVGRVQHWRQAVATAVLAERRVHESLELRVQERTSELKHSQEDAARDQARFKFIVDAAPVGISWMIVGRTETRIVNEAHARITGVPQAHCQELDRYFQATHPDDRVAQASLQQQLDAGKIEHYSLEKRYVHPDGAIRWTVTTVRYFRDSVSREIQKLSTVVDITEQRQTQEALRAGEDHFRFLNQIVEATRPLVDPEQIMAVMARMLGEHLRASRCAYADVDKDGDQFTILHDYTDNCPTTVGNYHLALFGPQAVGLLNRGETLIIRNVDTELTPAEGADMFNAIGIKAIITCPLVKGGRLRAMMAVHQTTPRNWKPAEIAIVQEIVERCWATIERRTAEEKLRQSEGLLRIAVNLARLGGWAVDLPEWRVTWSDEVCAIHDLPPGTVPDREQAFAYYVPESRDAVRQAFETCAKHGLPFNLELELRTATGRAVWVRCLGEAERNTVGEINRVRGAFQDITARKQADIELDWANTRLLAVSRKAAMAEFATGILHNVGNVLNSVSVASVCVGDSLRKSKISNLAKVVAWLREHDSDLGRYLTEDAKGRQIPRYLAELADQLALDQTEALTELGQLEKNLDHIRQIITTQQALARTSGSPEAVNLGDLVDDAVRINLSDAVQRGLEVTKAFAATSRVLARKHQVLQILVNLLSNARQSCEAAGGPKKKITIQITERNGRAYLAVTDTGVGIPPENLAHIFTHGFTTKKDGHGFGLHSAAVAAREMAGSLSVKSDGLGQGCTFTLELPCAAGIETA